MRKFLIVLASIAFLSGCSSSLGNDKKATDRNSRHSGFNIVKYGGDLSPSPDESRDDNFYENGFFSHKNGFKVVKTKRPLGVKNAVVVAKKIVVKKSKRKMYVFRSDGVVKEYLVSLGKVPVGKKVKMGDGKTPEGNYDISYHNPNSQFFYSLKISYPNKSDIRNAYSKGVNPGGDIFIHGLPNKDPRYINYIKRDWTNGCIAVSNEDIKEIAAVVSKGTPITIDP